MKLCFGTFTTVLALCKSASATNKQLCGTILLSVAPSEYDLTVDDDLTSKLIRCERNLSPIVKKPAQTANPIEVAGYFKRAVLPLIDDNKYELIIRALKDMISGDETINDGAIIDKVENTTKEALKSKSEFGFHDFLAGVFLYVVLNVKNTDGAASVKEITADYMNRFAGGDEIHIRSIHDFSMEIAGEITPDLTKFPSRTEDLLLLQEVESRCPLCQDMLIHQKGGVALRNYKIVDIQAPVQKGGRPQDRYIALCMRCGGEFVSQHTIAENENLKQLKKALVNRRKFLESVAGIQIDEQIEAVLRTIADTPKEKLTLQMEPSAVEKKIQPGEVPLFIKISGNVRYYFNRVQSILQGLDANGRLRSKEIAEDIHACYNQLKRAGQSQEQVFDDLVEWLLVKSKIDYKIACEILVSFFVQDCEVFDVIAE